MPTTAYTTGMGEGHRDFGSALLHPILMGEDHTGLRPALLHPINFANFFVAQVAIRILQVFVEAKRVGWHTIRLTKGKEGATLVLEVPGGASNRRQAKAAQETKQRASTQAEKPFVRARPAVPHASPLCPTIFGNNQ